MSRRLRPVRPLAPVAGTLVGLGVWAAVARSSGSGWVQGLGTVVGGILITGLLLPAVVVGRARVRCLAGPTDGVVGSAGELQMAVCGPVRVRAVRPSGPAEFLGPQGPLHVLPTRRGVLHEVTVELASAAPFGIMWWRRLVDVTLPHPLYVGPQPAPPGTFGSTGADGSAAPRAADVEETRGEGNVRAAGPGEPHGIRPYVAGDDRRQVHWPATAHTGALMIRAREGNRPAPVTVVVRLPAEPDAAEAAAGVAQRRVLDLLAGGSPVILDTVEQRGTVVGPVANGLAAARRLAAAVDGDGTEGPAARHARRRRNRPRL